MHLSDAVIQSDMHCISRYTFTFLSVLVLLSLGIKPMILALQAPMLYCFRYRDSFISFNEKHCLIVLYNNINTGLR